jgi:hypothetical protein
VEETILNRLPNTKLQCSSYGSHSAEKAHVWQALFVRRTIFKAINTYILFMKHMFMFTMTLNNFY